MKIFSQFLSKEASHPRKTTDLGKLCAIAKRIREPESLAPRTEATLKVSLPEKKLASQTLTTRHVGIVLNPAAANVLELALVDMAADVLERLGVILLEPLELLGR